MKFCWTQPPWLASSPSFSIVWFTVSRNAFASSGVASGVDDGAREQEAVPNAPKAMTAAAASISFFMRIFYDLRRREQRLGGIRQKLIQVAVRGGQQRAVDGLIA